MKGKREADNNFNFNFKSEKLDELRSRVDAAFDEHGDEAWEQIKGIFTHPKRPRAGAAEQGQYAEGSQPAAGR